MKKPLILFCVLLISLAGAAQSRFSIDNTWSFASLGDDLGLAGIVAEDIDKNGSIELVLSSTSEGSNFTTNGYFSVVEYDAVNARYYSKYTSQLFLSAIASLQSFDIDGDGDRELLAGFSNGDIRIFDHQYREIRFARTYGDNSIFSTYGGISSVALGDIDNDGQNNIVATNGDSTYVYNTALQLIKKFKLPGGKVVLANIDNDPALEAIYSKGRVVQISSTAIQTEFNFFPATYSPTRVRVADMNRDGILDVIYNSRDSVHMVSGILKQKFRSIAKKQGWTSSDVSDFQLYDYTMDGVPDVFAGNDQFEVLYVYNGQTTLFDFDIQDPKQSGIDALVIAALDDQPGPEIIWASGAHCSCSDHVFVYGMATRQMKWMSRYVSGGFQAFDFGNVNGTSSNDPLELVVGSYGTFTNYYDEDFLTTFDLTTKKVLKESNTLTGSFTDGPTAIEIVDLDDDGKDEILVGHEGSYSYATVSVYNENYVAQRSFTVDGMSYIADMEVADVNSDGRKELIVTSGTNVGGSTHPDEWQNYIYIFDAQSGAQIWRSEKLASMYSRLGNIRVANIDGDPAKEIVILRYYAGWSAESSPVLYIIDGWNLQLSSDDTHDYRAFDVSDFDQDGRDDIVAAVSGKILVLDGETLVVKKQFAPSKGNINAVECVDLNDDGADEYIFTNTEKVFIYDVVHGVVSESERLGEHTGLYTPIRVHQTSGGAEFYVATSHTLYGFNIGVTANDAPKQFRLLTPVDHAELPQPEMIDFSWERSDDDEQVTYSVYITGPGVDTVITRVPQTHVGVPVSLFEKGESYTWSVMASDGLAQTSTETYSFRIIDELVTGVEGKESELLQVYPNPFTQGLVIKNASSKEIDEIKIFDLDGREQQVIALDLKGSMEVSISNTDALIPGMYICLLMRDGIAVKTTKLVKR